MHQQVAAVCVESAAVTCIRCGVVAGSVEMTWNRCGDSLMMESEGEDDTYNLKTHFNTLKTQTNQLINKSATQLYLCRCKG